MAEYTVYVESKHNEEVRIDIEFDYHIENDGIGAYEYWGAKCYDAGTDYMEFDGITDAWLVRECLKAKTKEEIPAIHGIFEVRQLKDGTWMYSHARRINKDTAAIDNDRIAEEICEDYDWKADIPEPDYDYYEDRY